MQYNISLVLLYVDATDPAWIRQYQQYSSSPDKMDTERFDPDTETIYWAIKSALHFMPWLNQVFVVVDDIQKDLVKEKLIEFDQVVRIITHSQIISTQHLPIFNSLAIEDRLVNIPGLDEHFIYANDDMFATAKLYPEDFFSPDDGSPSIQFACRRYNHGEYLRYRETGDKFQYFTTGSYEMLHSLDQERPIYFSKHVYTPMTLSILKLIQRELPFENYSKFRYDCDRHTVMLNSIVYPTYLKMMSTYTGPRELNLTKNSNDGHIVCINASYIHTFKKHTYESNMAYLKMT